MLKSPKASQYKSMNWQASSREAGMRLHSFLKLKLPESFSTKMIKRAIDNKACSVNGRVEMISTYRICQNDQIQLAWHRTVPTPSKKLALGAALYEDEHLCIIAKPVGMVCDAKGVEALAGESLYLVHRLDKETSGALILAKNKSVQKEIEELFAKRCVLKTYLALVEGAPKKRRGSIQNYLGKKKSPCAGQAIWGSVSSQEGFTALTDWELVATDHTLSLLRVFPKTGRTHQIRVHMSEMGTPILGDSQYAPKQMWSQPVLRHMLHAYEIAFEYRGRKIVARAPIPHDMGVIVKALPRVSNE